MLPEVNRTFYNNKREKSSVGHSSKCICTSKQNSFKIPKAKTELTAERNRQFNKHRGRY